MAYTPSKHTTSNKPYGVQGIPDGARSYYYDEVLFKYRLFQNVEEALIYFDTPAKRAGHFSIIINNGGTLINGSITGGTNYEYWFRNGVADINLVLKFPDPVEVQPVDLSDYYNRLETGNLLSSKVDKEPGKVLSSNNYTDEEKILLGNQFGINTGDQDLSGLATVINLGTEITNRTAADTALADTIAALQTSLQASITTINNTLPSKADDSSVVHKSINETIDDIKTFTSSPLVPDATTNSQVLNLKKGRALPQDPIFSRNLGVIAKDQQIIVTGGYSRNFLQITPSNNYTHVKLFVTDGNSTVKAYEFQVGYDSLNSSWKQLTPYLNYQDRAGEFYIDIRAVDGFGPVNFGVLFRVRGITSASINYRIEYHQMTPALGGDYEDYTKLTQAEYLTTTQPISGLYPFQNQQATLAYVDQQDAAIIASITTKADKTDVGDKTSLTTATKVDLVAAINEVDARSKIIINSFQVINLLAADNVTVIGQITSDTNGNILIKSKTGETLMSLYQDETADEGLIDPGVSPGFPYTLPFALS